MTGMKTITLFLYPQYWI